MLHQLLQGLIGDGLTGADHLEHLPLLRVIEATAADDRPAVHRQVPAHHGVEHVAGELAEAQPLGCLAAAQGQAPGLHVRLALDAGVAEELGGIHGGAGPLGDVLEGPDRPGLGGGVGLEEAHGDGLRPQAVGQGQAVVPVDHIDLAVGRVFPDAHHAGQVRVPLPHPRQAAHLAGGGGGVEFVLEARGIEADLPWLHLPDGAGLRGAVGPGWELAGAQELGDLRPLEQLLHPLGGAVLLQGRRGRPAGGLHLAGGVAGRLVPGGSQLLEAPQAALPDR